MRLQTTKSKNAESFYVVKSIYTNGKRTNKIVEKLGTLSEVIEKADGEDPYIWAKNYVDKLNVEEKEAKNPIIVQYSPYKSIDKDICRSFNGGYLFLQQIYHELNLNKICYAVSSKYSFKYSLSAILSSLIYTRILYPGSKLSSFEYSKGFLENFNIDLHQIYRALSIIAKESDFIMKEVYKNSLLAVKRNTNILYYDCTNFFFETETAKGLKQYGVSKENRPNPIVQLGLFMDADGIPLAFCVNAGNTNEQTTLKPIEQKIITDYAKSKFVVCTDAGLASTANRKFNNVSDRAFVTTQSIKQLKGFLKTWALSPEGWTIDGKTNFNLEEIDEEQYKDTIFFKERWINENGLEQRLIVTYSIKYRNYQQSIRNEQITRAQKLLNNASKAIDKPKQTNYKRLISKTAVTKDGEIADKDVYSMNNELIMRESAYDGFYAVCTNLEGDAKEIIKINSRRWEIEECFRIMKTEFKARPVYLSRDDRIKAHFTVCVLALIVYRILEKKLECKYTTEKIIKTLQEMNFVELIGKGYIPTYKRTDITDDLHEKFCFRTDTEIVPRSVMKKIFHETRNPKHCAVQD